MSTISKGETSLKWKREFISVTVLEKWNPRMVPYISTKCKGIQILSQLGEGCAIPVNRVPHLQRESITSSPGRK